MRRPDVHHNQRSRKARRASRTAHDAAYGAAIDQLRDLLASLDEAGAGQADPGGNAPHAYIPARPVEAAPYLGNSPPEVRQEAFAAVLEGVETGTYDTQIVNWLTGWDDPTCRTIASLMWRCRVRARPHPRAHEGRPGRYDGPWPERRPQVPADARAGTGR